MANSESNRSLYWCDNCQRNTRSHVTDSRPINVKDDVTYLKRRRECYECKQRYTTIEVPVDAIDPYAFRRGALLEIRNAIDEMIMANQRQSENDKMKLQKVTLLL